MVLKNLSAAPDIAMSEDSNTVRNTRNYEQGQGFRGETPFHICSPKKIIDSNSSPAVEV